jgi:hypothetical protein
MITTYIVLVMALVSSVLLAFYTERGEQRQATFIYTYSLWITPIAALLIYVIIIIGL